MPRGAEARAVRRGARSARVFEVSAGAAAASALPDFGADETVVVLGLCGALRRLRAGDVAVYARVAGDVGAFALDAALVEALVAALPGAAAVSACTTDRVVTTAGARAASAVPHGARLGTARHEDRRGGGYRAADVDAAAPSVTIL